MAEHDSAADTSRSETQPGVDVDDSAARTSGRRGLFRRRGADPADPPDPAKPAESAKPAPADAPSPADTTSTEKIAIGKSSGKNTGNTKKVRTTPKTAVAAGTSRTVGAAAGSGTEPSPPALRELVDKGVLNEQQLDAVVSALAREKPRPTPAKILAEIAAYAGAGLLLSGVVLILVESWDDLARLGRFALFMLVAFGLSVAAVALAGGVRALARPAWVRVRAEGHNARMRLAVVLFVLAAVSVAAAVGSAFDTAEDDKALVYAAVAGLGVAIVGYAALPSVVGVAACAIFSGVVLLSAGQELLELDDTAISIGFVLLGVGWLLVSRFRLVLEVWAGYVVGIVLAVGGAQTVGDFESDRRVLSYVLTAAIALICFALYTTDRSWVLVLGGTGAVTLAAVQAVEHWTNSSGGASGAILVVGAVVLGIGSFLLSRSSRTSR